MGRAARRTTEPNREPTMNRYSAAAFVANAVVVTLGAAPLAGAPPAELVKHLLCVSMHSCPFVLIRG